MWHEARRQEKKIRGMLVDYQRRAERRRDFFETIKADPTQFLQIHGRQCKIHLDPAVAIAGDSPANMMPWQNNLDNMIDRFDVRAHLDYIPDTIPCYKEDLTPEERHCNYESYRILAQNTFLGIREEKFLQQLAYEEQFGITPEESNKKKKSSSNTGAAIGYNYENTEVIPGKSEKTDKDGNSDSSDSEVEIDMDVSIDITKVGLAQANEMNIAAQAYGMADNDFYSFLTKDADEAESLRIAREEEQEKAMYSGRKSRRERRQHKEKRLLDHHFTSFSFAVEKAPEEGPKVEKSVSRSPSPSSLGQITYITSFGGEEETGKQISNKSSGSILEKGSTSSLRKKSTYADKLKSSSVRRRRSRSRSRRGTRSSRSRSRSRSRNGHRRSRSYSKPRSYRQRSRSPYSSHRRRRSRTRSRSKTRSSRYHNSNRSLKLSSRRRSRSRSRRSRSRKRSRSRSTYSDSSSSSRSSHKSLTKKLSPTVSKDNDNDNSKDNSSANDVHSPVAGPPIKKYYGRKKGDESSSELSLSDSDDSDNRTRENPDIHTNSNASTDVQSLTNNSSGTPAQSTSSSLLIANPIISSTNTGTSTSVSGLFGKTKPNAINKAANKTSSGGGILNIQERLKRKMQAQLARTLKADKKAEIERNERVLQQQIERDEEMREMAIKIRRRQRAIRHRYNSDQSSHSSDESRSQSRSKSRSRSASPQPVTNELPRASYSDVVTRCHNDLNESISQGSKKYSAREDRYEDSKTYKDEENYKDSKSHRDDYRSNRDESKSYRDDSRSYRDDFRSHRDEARSSYRDDSRYSRRNDDYSGSSSSSKKKRSDDSDNGQNRGSKVKPLVDY
ncbi:CLK4-associating serine/arginine rich protein-like isoform X2 [Ctenocephalides felis]|uniref:CLK4-associating serine/arginine rich protein-like isoform X2 n=1 Tax=Ctenocephalides felis TaxID=7515 RepID=UPI000E6E599E|nr:CLK4-associating serine/arginine rich protein-like isoform X2 [Ctenocephalides felis]